MISATNPKRKRGQTQQNVLPRLRSLKLR
jgi:hypothetical protein